MDRIIMNRLDVARIADCIIEARRNDTISPSEVESLINEVNSAKVVEPSEIPPDVVTMNSKIRIVILNTGQVAEFMIVYPKQADIKEKKISIFSPVAAAVIGYKVNDEIEWRFPSGHTRIRIDQLIYQPEAAGHLNL